MLCIYWCFVFKEHCHLVIIDVILHVSCDSSVWTSPWLVHVYSGLLCICNINTLKIVIHILHVLIYVSHLITFWWQYARRTHTEQFDSTSILILIFHQHAMTKCFAWLAVLANYWQLAVNDVGQRSWWPWVLVYSSILCCHCCLLITCLFLAYHQRLHNLSWHWCVKFAEMF